MLLRLIRLSSILAINSSKSPKIYWFFLSLYQVMFRLAVFQNNSTWFNIFTNSAPLIALSWISASYSLTLTSPIQMKELIVIIMSFLSCKTFGLLVNSIATCLISYHSTSLMLSSFIINRISTSSLNSITSFLSNLHTSLNSCSFNKAPDIFTRLSHSF